MLGRNSDAGLLITPDNGGHFASGILVTSFQIIDQAFSDVLPVPPTVAYASGDFVLRTPGEVIQIHQTLDALVVGNYMELGGSFCPGTIGGYY